MQILDGRKAREHYVTLLQKRIKELAFTPCLVIIQVGNCTDSDSFINAKKFFAKKIGVKEIHVKCDVNINQNELLYIVEKCNDDKTAQGIIIQLPLPPHLNSEIIINSIDPKKDVDGLTPNTSFIPATARGISQLFDFYNIGLSGKKVTVIGRSKLVGTPIANMCRSKGAIVTVCHSKTEVEDVIKNTKNADILIVAIGKANLIDEKYISKGQIIIDVGITREDDRLVGDVNFEKVKDIVAMITPVPGGVGQMTVLALFENLIDACYT